MRKRVIFISLTVLLISLVCFTLYNKDTAKLDLKQLKGDLLIENKMNETNYTFGAIKYTTYNGNAKVVFNEDYYTPYYYSQDKSKILLLKYIQDPTVNDYVIFEYDIKNKVLTGLVKFKQDLPNEYSTVRFSNIRYIPGKRSISYLWCDKLYILDLVTKKETFVTNIDGNANSYYGWSNNGEKLVFSKNDIIHTLDISDEKKVTTTDMKGYSPIYSQGGKHIAYLGDENFKHCLKVRDTVTGEEWTYKTNDIIVNYVFSPDEKCLAIVEKDVGFFNLGAHEAGHIKVWDYKNSTFGTLIKYYEGNTIDWK